MKRKIFFSATLIVILLVCSCSDEITPPIIDPTEPVANAGENQTITVGSYFILDARKSTKGSGDTLIYKWSEDVNNLEQIYLFNDSVNYIFVKNEGIYKYNLVVNNRIKDSKPDELVVTVNKSDNIIFADPMLESQIRFKLQKQFGLLSDADLQMVDSIRIGGKLLSKYKITNLSGIERCRNLKQLLVSLQSITDVTPLASLTNLERLDIDQNRNLGNIAPLANLTQLKYLEIASTGINDISVLAPLTKLRYLNILFNPITDISVIKNFTELRQFWALQIPVTDLSLLAELKNLELLFFVFSPLKDISALSNLTNLKQMEISENEISDITPLTNLKELFTLRITDNEIEDITPLKNLTKLTDLWLSRNKIKDIKPLVDNPGLGNGVYIMLDGNPLNEKSINEYIPQLIARGVTVYL